MSVVLLGVLVTQCAGMAFAGWILLLVAACFLLLGRMMRPGRGRGAPEVNTLPATGWIVEATLWLVSATRGAPRSARAPPTDWPDGEDLRAVPVPTRVDRRRRRSLPWRNDLS
jgi:hypothetical protein